AGFTRVRIDGELYAIEEAPALDKKYKHDTEVVVDRLAVRDGIHTRLADSFVQAHKLAEGLAYVDLAGAHVAEAGAGIGQATAQPAPVAAPPPKLAAAMKTAGLPPTRIAFSEKFACPVSGFTLEAIEPRLFSVKAPRGACPASDGLGERLLSDGQVEVPDE